MLAHQLVIDEFVVKNVIFMFQDPNIKEMNVN